MVIKFLKFVLCVSIGLLIGYSIYGISVVSASDATVEFRDINTMDCFRYETNFNIMMVLQSELVQTKSKYKKLRLQKKINKLRPWLIETEIQCLWYGVTPN